MSSATGVPLIGGQFTLEGRDHFGLFGQLSVQRFRLFLRLQAAGGKEVESQNESGQKKDPAEINDGHFRCFVLSKYQIETQCLLVLIEKIPGFGRSKR